MSYRINISHKGEFHFEVSRLSDTATTYINSFVAKLRDGYPVKDGFKVTVDKVETYSRSTNI